MKTRREFVQVGLTAAAVPLAFAAPGASLYKFIFDERYPASVSAAGQAAAAGVRTHGIRGDITGLWYCDLYFVWKRGPAAIAGVTRPESLFCLELLARDAGLRLKSRSAQGDLVCWLIGPKG